ncbi:MAG: serine/threonine-protein kinase PknK [Myxococcaceae bacterium]|nr:serine/threonine-protein kinase PknK [Myxococcaceae bacterium]
MSQADFVGTKRYTPTRLLGAGSWGRVWQAYDAERNAFVAVKLLQRPSADALIRFKREFRALQDVVHPNLVTLYELLSDKDQWFFIMELVDGRNFLEHVHGLASRVNRSSSDPGDAPTINERLPSLHESTATVDGEGGVRVPRPSAPAGGAGRVPLTNAALNRLRDSLGQLVEGLSALHAAGKLHRDVKPSNVLVAKDGRVVLLDFGLVHELSEPDEKLNKGLVVGTPAYMSPEQAGGLKLDEASDWYAVGVLLHEALTGHVPFEGPSSQMLKARRTEDPIPPSRVARGVPDDLDALCLQLLARDPEKRPKGRELMERFKRAVTRPRAELPLFGRDAELEALRGAQAWVREKKAPALVSIEAPSGLGRTALLEAFLGEVKANDPTALVLMGTCGERESLPFKAFDGAIDALTSQLASWALPTLRSFLPRDFRSLMRVFPVLDRLKNALPEGAVEAPKDPLEIRRRAFVALKQLLVALGRQRTVVLALDDLHFGDEDSAALLAKLLEGPNLPPMLTVATFRTRDDSTREPDGAVRALEDAAFAAAGAKDVSLTRLVLAPLADGASRTMAVAHGAPVERVEAVVREAKGNPMLLGQLGAVAGEGAATVADWAAAHLSRLTPAARRLVEVLAVAQRPVARMVAWHAARLDTEASDPSMQLLAERLAATDGQRLWVYQRVVGHAVRSGLAEEERNRLLVALADALATSTPHNADFEAVADWAAEAGQVLRASVALEHAAEGAEKVFAFDRAAKLYERALSGRPEADAAKLQQKRASALASSGHGKQAAAIYLQLASKLPRSEALALRQLAAEQLLYSGHVDAGIAVMSEVLAALGEPMPKSETLTRAWAVVSRMRVQLHGLKFDVRPKETWKADELQRTDAYWAAAKGFSLVDPVRGTTFQFTHFRHALDCGDPYRIARALALEAGFHALMGVRHKTACHQALALLAGVLKDHPNDHAEGLSELMAGSAALGIGRFKEARRHFEYAVGIFEEKCPAMTWEISSSLQYLAYTLTNLGEYEQVCAWMNEVREWAQARGDTYALTNFRVRVGPIVRLMVDDPSGAKNEIGAALQEFSRAGYYTQHLWGYLGHVAALLYEGKDAEAVEREEAEWPKIRGAGLMRIQFTRVLVGFMRGELAALNPKAPVTAVTRLARLLEGEGIAWATGLAKLLHAAAAARGGQVALALEHLDEGARLLDEVGALTHAIAAKRAAAELRGLPGEADAWLTARGVKRPEAFARAFFALPRP